MPPKAKGRGKAAAGHQLASTLPKAEELKDLRKKSWYLGEPIGSGGFGLIYLADDDKKSISSAKAKYVIKVEPHDNGPLYCEVAFYQRAAKQDMLTSWMKKARLPYVGIPAYIAHGLHQHGKENLRFMVMPRFGTDLHNLWVKAEKRFKRATVCQIAIELINALQYMHENEYVHADVKGANILLGHDNPNQIYLVDFGLAYRYLVDGKHKEYLEDPRKAHDGTIEYTSRDAHLGVAPSRRADMEILGYVLLHWLTGRLPWEDKLMNKAYVKEQKMKYMGDIKELIAETCLDAETKKATEIQRYLENISKLDYDEVPKYDFLRKLFQDALKSMNIPVKSKISFEAEQPASSVPRKKKRAQASKAKSSQSPDDSEEDETPVKRPKRATNRRKKETSSEDDISSIPSTSASDAQSPVKSRPKYSKKTAVSKNTKSRKTKRVTSTDENSTGLSDGSCVLVESPVPLPRNGRLPGRKQLPPRNSKATSSKRTIESTEHSSEDIEIQKHSAADQESPRTRSSVDKSTKNVTEESSFKSLARSRYSMAPLHTESVLAKEDKLSGKYAGKHPVIIRRRKVKRPRQDAVTQTTPSLKKTSSRI